MSMTLYNIEETLLDLSRDRMIAELEGDSEAIVQFDKALGAYLTQEATKVNSYAGLIHSREADADAAEHGAARATALAKSARADVGWLKGNALAVMQRFGVRVLETPTNKLRIQGNGGKQELDIPE